MACLSGMAQAGTVCDLYFPACPDRFVSSTITVPMGIIGLSPRIPACPGMAQAASGDSAMAIRAVLTVNGISHASTGVSEGNLLFPAAVPLSEAATGLTLSVEYAYSDSTLSKVGAAGAARGVRTVSYSITVRRSAAATDLPSGLSAFCREQPSLGLFEGGREIAALSPDQAVLEARLTMPGGLDCAGCRIEVGTSPVRAAGRDAARSAVTAGLDRELLPMVPARGHLAATLARETGGQAVPGDGRIQHLPGDSLVLAWRNPANPLDFVRRAYPFPNPGATLGVSVHNAFSRVQGLSWAPSSWMLVGAPALRVAATEGSPGRTRTVPVSSVDSRRHVGLHVEASRSFRADIRVYDNLGQYVNRVSFSVPPSEFSKLPPGPDGKTRQLTVLWDNRAEDGRPAGTGAYVIKSTITLDRLPGLPAEDVFRTESRLVGVLRSL